MDEIQADVTPDKPPYRVPTLPEVDAVEWTGLVAADSFSGGGGTCLGLRMAGYRVAWANEFVEAARECYAANAAPWTVLDPRDVREVKGTDVLDAAEGLTGERRVDLFTGSPPCTSFSTAGIRERGWGREMSHADGSAGRSDDLFLEYARLVDEIRPACFAAENVSGLVKGMARGYFAEIHAALAALGYRVQARMLDAQWLGVPQARQRVIIVGVRDDLGADPAFPDPLPYRYSIRDALPNLTGYRFDTAGQNQAADPRRPVDEPAPTVLTHGRAHTHSELTAVVHHPPADPDSLYLERGPGDDGRAASLDDPAPTIAAAGVGNVREYQASLPAAAPVLDPETGARIDLGDTAIGPRWDKLLPGEVDQKFAGSRLGPGEQRYYSLIRPHPDAPIHTVTASGGGRGTAGVTHPTQRRKLTLAELRRLCGFPDDFTLPGTYQEGWARLGNAVPPPMAMHVAAALRDRVLLPAREAAGRPKRRRRARAD